MVGEFGCKRFLIVVVLAIGKLRAVEELAQPPEELRLERADGEVAAVGRGIDAVTRERAGEKPGHGLAAEAVRDEVVRAVRHRDDDPRAAARACTFQERGEHLRDGSERARRQVGDLDRRKLRGRVLEDARPAEVVDVVPARSRWRASSPKPVIEQ